MKLKLKPLQLEILRAVHAAGDECSFQQIIIRLDKDVPYVTAQVECELLVKWKFLASRHEERGWKTRHFYQLTQKGKETL